MTEAPDRSVVAHAGRPFVSHFLLPLVKGGPLHVGRPLGARAVAAMIRVWCTGARRAFTSLEGMAEEDALTELGRLRHARARTILFEAEVPPLDATTLRLGVSVHNLLALGHPELGGKLPAGVAGRTLQRRQEQIVEATLPIADLGPPPSAVEAVRRHSLLGRLGEITRSEHLVEYWAGRRRFVGRTPPTHLLAMPRLRRVSTSSQRRLWWKEIGVPTCGRPLWIALHRASPLGEALDPMRFDPPLGWERILPVLRFPALGRLVVGHLLDLGLERAGAPLVSALMRFVSLNDSAGATPEAVSFAVRFLAHAFWLQHLYAPDGGVSSTSDVSILVVAAADVEPGLVCPPDVAENVALYGAFRARLDGLGAEVRSRAAERYQAALALCRFAASANSPPALL